MGRLPFEVSFNMVVQSCTLAHRKKSVIYGLENVLKIILNMFTSWQETKSY